MAFHCAAHRFPVEQELELVRWLRDLLLLLWRAQVDLLDLVQLSLLRVLLLESPRTLFLPLLLLQLAGSASSKVRNLTFSATQARRAGGSEREKRQRRVRQRRTSPPQRLQQLQPPQQQPPRAQIST